MKDIHGYKVCFRGKNKRLAKPPSEYSLDTIKSKKTNSTISGGEDCDNRASPFDVNPNESSHLVQKHSGYDTYLNFFHFSQLKTAGQNSHCDNPPKSKLLL